MPRVRFAPSPTGFLHIGSARTYIFNWLYARHNGGTMILRIDDTDVGRNTDASLNSIFDGLRWLDLGWDEEYKQSDRLALHRDVAQAIFEKGLAYRDFTLAQGGDTREIRRRTAPGSAIPACANSRAKKATAAPPPASPSPCASACRTIAKATSQFTRRRLRRTGQSLRRYRGFRPAAQRRHAHLSPRQLRRRRRPAHHATSSAARSTSPTPSSTS